MRMRAFVLSAGLLVPGLAMAAPATPTPSAPATAPAKKHAPAKKTTKSKKKHKTTHHKTSKKPAQAAPDK